jgi:hypothetical protein
MFRTLVFAFLSLIVIHFTMGQVACGNGPGMLCYGSSSAECSIGSPDCSSYPRCGYSGTISGYYCYHNCYNTGQVSTCGAGRVCLCVNRTVCSLCSFTGQDLSVCNDVSGCGPLDPTPPTVQIILPTASPTYSTTVSPINLSGAASDNTIVSQVTWYNNRNDGAVGGSGTAIGTTSWDAGLVNLEPGSNVITVSATDGTGNIGTDTITVNYNPPTNSGYPVISLSESSTSYTITINDPDSFTEVSYGWTDRPSVYILIPFASDSVPQLSSEERRRYSMLVSTLSDAWDNLTDRKHPMDFYFLEPFVIDYATTANNHYNYIRATETTFESLHQDIIRYPAVYVLLYPEPYFGSTYTTLFGADPHQLVAEVYMDGFNDNDPGSDTHLRNVLLHELVHDFASLPNNVNIPGNPKYFWEGHPAGFYGVSQVCDEGTSLGGCKPYGAVESPTSTAGYYEAYSILSLTGSFNTSLSPLVEMALGIRSKYEDAPYLFYEVQGTGYVPHDYGISSRRLTDYNSVERTAGLYWDIRFDTVKTQLPVSTRTFTVAKSGQNGSALIVFASDSQNPGYFKVFNANAQSVTYPYLSDTAPPVRSSGAPSGTVTTVSTSISLMTDEPAVCRYSTTAGAYGIMNQFSVTGDIFHATSLSGLSNASTYRYYVKCADTLGNTNLDDYLITFTVYCMKADTACDGCIDTADILRYVDRWRAPNSDVTMGELIGAIAFWKSGCLGPQP